MLSGVLDRMEVIIRESVSVPQKGSLSSRYAGIGIPQISPDIILKADRFRTSAQGRTAEDYVIFTRSVPAVILRARSCLLFQDVQVNVHPRIPEFLQQPALRSRPEAIRDQLANALGNG